EVEQAAGVIRLRLKEGQARRLQLRDLPPLDRPVRFIVLRGKRDAVRADTVEDLRRQLSGLSRAERVRLVRGRPRRQRPGDARPRPGPRDLALAAVLPHTLTPRPTVRLRMALRAKTASDPPPLSLAPLGHA